MLLRMADNFTIVPLPRWHWPSYGEAKGYGWRHSLVICNRQIFWGKMTAAKLKRAWVMAHGECRPEGIGIDEYVAKGGDT